MYILASKFQKIHLLAVTEFVEIGQEIGSAVPAAADRQRIQLQSGMNSILKWHGPRSS